MLRHNTTDFAPEAHDGADWFSLDLRNLVTFGNSGRQWGLLGQDLHNDTRKGTTYHDFNIEHL